MARSATLLSVKESETSTLGSMGRPFLKRVVLEEHDRVRPTAPMASRDD